MITRVWFRDGFGRRQFTGVRYGDTSWPSYSEWMPPGTLDPYL
ncbi:hypothetical protein [Methylobacterium marchantiae]|uniref:Uncharacterized protein n=1 Tax=Methylobacterium marchantiae TaxID=600331 RepID=A0ABW3X5J5_9HYPH|nr:hypothetical protein AIGOOFII_3461 [Methylobacterium marchantiae]